MTLAVASVALVCACGMLSASEPEAAPVPDARVTNVRFSQAITPEHEPVDVQFRFDGAVREVWAVVDLTQVTADVTLEGRWWHLGPDGDSEPTLLAEAAVEIEAADDETLVRSGLQLLKESFEPGTYELTVSLDGHDAASQRFEVGATP